MAVKQHEDDEQALRHNYRMQTAPWPFPKSRITERSAKMSRADKSDLRAGYSGAFVFESFVDHVSTGSEEFYEALRAYKGFLQATSDLPIEEALSVRERTD